MTRAEKLVDDDIFDFFRAYVQDINIKKYDFIFALYAYYEGWIEQEYSRLVISYPSVKSYYPGFDRALEKLKTHVNDFLVSRFDYPIRVETESRDSYETLMRTRIAQVYKNEIVPIILGGPYIGVRAEQYEQVNDQLWEELPGANINGVSFIKPYGVWADLFPLMSERASGNWDYVDAEFYRLGYFNYVNIPILSDWGLDIILDKVSEHKTAIQEVSVNGIDLTGLDGLSELIREEIRKVPDSENSTIIIPLTGVFKLLFEVLSEEIITRDDKKGDYYKVLLFEGREIILVTEEWYDCMLWLTSTWSNSLSIMLKHRDFFNDMLRTKDLEWVIEFVRVTNSLGLSERERFLLESLESLLAGGFNIMSWCWVDFNNGDFSLYRNLFDLYKYLFDLFKEDFRDRFKVLDSRVGRFEDG